MLAPVFEAVLDGQAAVLDLLLAARDLWPGLARRAGVPLERSGTVAAGREPWLAGVRAGLMRLGLHGADLPRSTAEMLIPGLGPGLETLLVREDWRLDPVSVLAALRGAAEAAGVSFRPTALHERGDADWLVVATGAAQGLKGVAPELAHLAPIKGQILRYGGVPTGPFSLRGEKAYAVPSADGLAIGATMEPGRSDCDPDPVALTPLISAGEALFPDLQGVVPTIAAGVRAATPDGLPMVGLSQTPGVILAVGARRNGWLLAPLVAGVVRAYVTAAEPGAYAGRLDPARFGPGGSA